MGWHPISYYSRQTNPAESKYHSFELETLAVISALRRFRVYVEGLPIRIVTDCNSLTQTLAKKNLSPQIARWALELENYNFEMIHSKGNIMGHVDALSRTPDVAPVSEENADYHALFVQNDDIDFHMQAAQFRDPIITDLRKKIRNH